MGNVPRMVYFDFDSYAVKRRIPAARSKRYAKTLVADRKKAPCQVEGHTDDRGGSEYNLALGQKRAEAVDEVAGAAGRAADAQVEAVSFGKERPAVRRCSDEAAYAKNRRAELNVRDERTRRLSSAPLRACAGTVACVAAAGRIRAEPRTPVCSTTTRRAVRSSTSGSSIDQNTEQPARRPGRAD